MDVIELNEAFAAQSLGCTRELGLADDDPRVNPNGGAIALGHPLGMSGARLLLTAARELEETGGQLRAVHDVHRRRAGDGDDHRARCRRADAPTSSRSKASSRSSTSRHSSIRTRR